MRGSGFRPHMTVRVTETAPVARTLSSAPRQQGRSSPTSPPVIPARTWWCTPPGASEAKPPCVSRPDTYARPLLVHKQRDSRSRSGAYIALAELGGSDDIADLYKGEGDALPRRRAGLHHAKDKLKNKLHDLVCDGTMTLRSVHRQIAANWQGLYKKAFGVAP